MLSYKYQSCGVFFTDNLDVDKHGMNMDNEQALKTQIIKSAESVRRKLKTIRDLKSNNDMVIDSIFKPISEPLKQMADKSTPAKEFTKESVSPLKKYIKRKSSTPMTGIQKKTKFLGDNDFYGSDTDSDKNIDFFHKTSDHSEDEDPEQSTKYFSEPNISSLSYKTDENDSSDSNRCMSMSEKYENIPFGIRRERGKLMMGTSRVSVDDYKIRVARQIYLRTPGLYDLLFKKSPDLSLVTEDDKQNYKKMLLATNVHRRDYSATKPIKSNKGLKYTKVIKPLFMKLSKNCVSTESLSHGSGLPIIKKLNQNTDYVYWDDANELVDRLKLLIASRDAGNTGLDNEIISIIEELRESGIIN